MKVKCVYTIVMDYLTKNKFDGLVNEDTECACYNKELMPCDEDCSLCKPAKKRKATTKEITGCGLSKNTQIMEAYDKSIKIPTK